MLINKKIRKFIVLPVLTLLFLFSLLVLLNTLIQKKEIQDYLIEKIFCDSGFRIKTGKIELDILGPPGILIKDFKVSSEESGISIEASSFNISFDKGRLLRGEFYPVKAVLISPVINADSKKGFNTAGRPDRQKVVFPFDTDRINSFRIENGQVSVIGHIPLKLDSLFLEARLTGDNKAGININSRGLIDYRNHKSPFSSEGSITPDPADLLKSTVHINLRTENTPAEWTPWSKFIEMRSGCYNSNINLEGSSKTGLNAEGAIDFKGLDFILTKKGRTQEYDIKDLHCSLKGNFKDKVISIESLRAENSDVTLDINCMLDFSSRNTPYFRMILNSNFMPVDVFRKNYPFPTTKAWVEDTLFPLFESGDIKIENLILDGEFNQFHNLRDTENRSAIGMSFICKNFRLSGRGIQFPFTDVSTRIDISEGNLEIPELKGIFGNSVIEKASLDVRDIARDAAFRVSVKGDFDVRELISVRKMEVIPENARRNMETLEGMTGRLRADTVIKYKNGSETPEILTGEFLFRGLMHNRKYFDLPVYFNELDLHVNKSEGSVFNAKGLLGDMSFSSSGLFNIDKNTLSLINAKTSARVDMNTILGKICGDRQALPLFDNRLDWQIYTERGDDSYRHSGEADLSSLAMKWDRFFLQGAGKGDRLLFDLESFPAGRILLKHGRILFGGSWVDLSGRYNTLAKRLETLRAETGALNFKDIGLHIMGNSGAPEGSLSGRIDIDFPEKKKDPLNLNGQIRGKDLSFNPYFIPAPVKDLEFRLDLAGAKGSIDDCTMKLGDSTVNLRGSLEGWSNLKGNLLLTSDFLDLTEFIPGRRGQPEERTAAKGPEPEISLKIIASEGLWREIKLSHLAADLVLSNDLVTVKNAQANLEKGSLSLKGSISGGDIRKLDISGDIRVREQLIDKLISDAGFGDKGVKGTLSADASIRITGNAGDSLLKNMSGELKDVKLVKGLIRNSRVFPRILEFLNIPDKFKVRPQDMREEGFYFERIQGDAEIEKGILKTENFVMKSPAFNAVGSGEENLYEMTHNFRLLVQPLGNIDYLIKLIPIVGRIFVEDDETLFRVGYDIKGAWGKPELDIVPAENLKGLFEVLKRAILTPVKLIEDINNVTINRQKNGSEAEEEKTAPPP